METYSSPILNQEEINSLNRAITKGEIKCLKKKKKLPANKSLELDSFTAELYQT